MQNTLEETSTPAPADARDRVVDERAFAARTVLVSGAIGDVSASEVVRRLVALDNESDAPIRMLVTSPGGHVESGDAIHNVVRFIAAPVTMIGNGWVGSAATHVYLSVPPERRVCLPHTRFLIHQPSGGIGGKGTDIAIQAREILKIRERIAGVIARETGKGVEEVLQRHRARPLAVGRGGARLRTRLAHRRAGGGACLS